MMELTIYCKVSICAFQTDFTHINSLNAKNLILWCFKIVCCPSQLSMLSICHVYNILCLSNFILQKAQMQILAQNLNCTHVHSQTTHFKVLNLYTCLTMFLLRAAYVTCENTYEIMKISYVILFKLYKMFLNTFSYFIPRAPTWQTLECSCSSKGMLLDDQNLEKTMIKRNESFS